MPTYSYEHPRPAVTVDVIALARDGRTMRTLLVRRGAEPFAGRWAFPGGFLGMDEPSEVAALRELEEETGFRGIPQHRLARLGAYDDPARDPRGRVISVAFLAMLPECPSEPLRAGDDAADAAWVDVRRLAAGGSGGEGGESLAFDHDAMLAAALERARLAARGPEGLLLLPDEFGDKDIRQMLIATGNPARNAYHWRNAMTRDRLIEPVAPGSKRYRRAGAPAPAPTNAPAVDHRSTPAIDTQTDPAPSFQPVAPAPGYPRLDVDQPRDHDADHNHNHNHNHDHHRERDHAREPEPARSWNDGASYPRVAFADASVVPSDDHRNGNA